MEWILQIDFIACLSIDFSMEPRERERELEKGNILSMLFTWLESVVFSEKHNLFEIL